MSAMSPAVPVVPPSENPTVATETEHAEFDARVAQVTELPAGAMVGWETKHPVPSFTHVLVAGEPFGICLFAMAGDPGIAIRFRYDDPEAILVETVTGPVRLFQNPFGLSWVGYDDAWKTYLGTPGTSPVTRFSVPYRKVEKKEVP